MYAVNVTISVPPAVVPITLVASLLGPAVAEMRAVSDHVYDDGGMTSEKKIELIHGGLSRAIGMLELLANAKWNVDLAFDGNEDDERSGDNDLRRAEQNLSRCIEYFTGDSAKEVRRIMAECATDLVDRYDAVMGKVVDHLYDMRSFMKFCLDIDDPEVDQKFALSAVPDAPPSRSVTFEF